jgi:hypothetical protein
MTANRSISVLVGLLGVVWAAGPAAAQVDRYSPGVNPYAAGYRPGYGYYGGYGPYTGVGSGGILQGQAAKIDATGQYYKDIQQASMEREKVRQESLVTQKKRVVAEMEYEDMRKARFRQQQQEERSAILDRARRNPTDDEIWSGKTLNILLKSIMMSQSSAVEPSVALSQTTLSGLNLTATGTNGNLGIAKDGGKIDWTDALMEAPFDDSRKRFSGNFETAMNDVQAGKQPDRAVIADLRRDYKSLSDTLSDKVADLSPDDYNSSRRRLNQLKVALDGLTDRRALRSFNSAWKKDVRNVAELVSYCKNNGVEFGAATADGDRACYESAYYSVRSYEREVAGYSPSIR